MSICVGNVVASSTAYYRVIVGVVFRGSVTVTEPQPGFGQLQSLASKLQTPSDFQCLYSPQLVHTLPSLLRSPDS